jgi:DNA transformation protein and related proteins
MDRDFILELFSEFGPVTLRRMFSGYGVSADGVNFAMALRGGLIFRADEQTIAKFEAEGSKPFQYDTAKKTVVVKSYWHLPERLYDDTEELAIWAREAVGAAQRAALKKPKKKRPAKAVARTRKPARKAGKLKTKPKKTARKTTRQAT